MIVGSAAGVRRLFGQDRWVGARVGRCASGAGRLCVRTLARDSRAAHGHPDGDVR